MQPDEFIISTQGIVSYSKAIEQLGHGKYKEYEESIGPWPIRPSKTVQRFVGLVIGVVRRDECKEINFVEREEDARLRWEGNQHHATRKSSTKK